MMVYASRREPLGMHDGPGRVIITIQRAPCSWQPFLRIPLAESPQPWAPTVMLMWSAYKPEPAGGQGLIPGRYWLTGLVLDDGAAAAIGNWAPQWQTLVGISVGDGLLGSSSRKTSNGDGACFSSACLGAEIDDRRQEQS